MTYCSSQCSERSALRIVCGSPPHTLPTSDMFYLCFIGPTVEKIDQGGQSLLCPAVASLVLVLLVEFQDCCFARPSFKLSHCFKVPATALFPLVEKVWGCPSSLKGMFTIESHTTCAHMLSVQKWLYLCDSGARLFSEVWFSFVGSLEFTLWGLVLLLVCQWLLPKYVQISAVDV